MSYETVFMRGVWTQGRLLVGIWARQRRSHLAFLAVFALIGASIGAWLLVPALATAEAQSSERFSAADNLTTYGYSNAHDNFNSAETNITAYTARNLKQKWAHKTGNGISRPTGNSRGRQRDHRLLGLMGWLFARDEREIRTRRSGQPSLVRTRMPLATRPLLVYRVHQQ